MRAHGSSGRTATSRNATPIVAYCVREVGPPTTAGDDQAVDGGEQEQERRDPAVATAHLRRVAVGEVGCANPSIVGVVFAPGRVLRTRTPRVRVIVMRFRMAMRRSAALPPALGTPLSGSACLARFARTGRVGRVRAASRTRSGLVPAAADGGRRRSGSPRSRCRRLMARAEWSDAAVEQLLDRRVDVGLGEAPARPRGRSGRTRPRRRAPRAGRRCTIRTTSPAIRSIDAPRGRAVRHAHRQRRRRDGVELELGHDLLAHEHGNGCPAEAKLNAQVVELGDERGDEVVLGELARRASVCSRSSRSVRSGSSCAHSRNAPRVRVDARSEPSPLPRASATRKRTPHLVSTTSSASPPMSAWTSDGAVAQRDAWRERSRGPAGA